MAVGSSLRHSCVDFAEAPNPSGTSSHSQFGNPLRTIQGVGSRANLAIDSAILNAIAKAPPGLQPALRQGLLAMERPGGILGALALTHLTRE